MTATMLANMGLDPSFLIGGIVEDFDTNGRNGSGDLYVAEADESDASFLLLDPDIVVVTNIEADHLDHYGSLEAIEEAFSQFMASAGEDGTVICCGENPHVVELARAAGPAWSPTASAARTTSSAPRTPPPAPSQAPWRWASPTASSPT